ncbi:tyrosine-type recombinase/integrase [Desulfosporosinus nitroreducens]|uniref:Tyrosine-type recombinase/integrase n=1 Tax=Desulfosporosinus nitroreducens TaxID=2018668 RepID=A0ABT8QVK8_9FIRM|nr:tyrosine-type recombinase/integrase [Desulfosporosinus nitroreducens]MDO0825381.1 tyrosine-type recombinase/integrase [Desulfosporosinus nitroreducens]
MPTQEKQVEINNLLSGYWENDVWDQNDPFFDNFRPEKWPKRTNKIDFSEIPFLIRNEIKFLLATRLINKEINLVTVIQNLGKRVFISRYYPQTSSIVDISLEKSMLQYRTYLAEVGIAGVEYPSALRSFHAFFMNYYDMREEMEKDIWDCRKIPGAKITQTQTNYLLNFKEIPLAYRDFVKKYIKVRLYVVSQSHTDRDVEAIGSFLNFINEKYPAWNNLKELTRMDMEDFLSWYKQFTTSKGYKTRPYQLLYQIKTFLEYIQIAEYPEAPIKPSVNLLFKEDIAAFKPAERTENDIKYIHEGVLYQLEDNLEYLNPPEYIPTVILLRASGWRISDIFNLRYDTCLDQTSQGWYLCGDITKTSVSNHRVPITDEVAAVIKALIDEVEAKSTKENNPNKLLFVRMNGTRKGRCPMSLSVQRALNQLAQDRKIVNDQGKIFHFGNHAFRHTKGVELINNGMSLLHVQKWMAHATPEMTLVYAKILDTTMRKSWEEATKQGLFRIDPSGKATKIDVTNIQNDDLIEWEYIRSNLDAVRMPLGYCMKPKKQECHTQLNPCLTCRNLCTTPDFIPQYELEIQETKTMIARGKAQGRSIWAEKNEVLLERYKAILAVLKDGKTHHKAGKKGRELIGEERVNGKRS